MGAINFSVDINLIKLLQTNLNINTFVETGTFQGDTIDKVKNYFKEIYTIELSAEYHQHAKIRFENIDYIHPIHGDSVKVLTRLVHDLSNRPTLYWLDAHWCVASNTAGELSQCPLLGEIESIHQLHMNSVIIIDDARLFLAPPPMPHEISQWPTFDEIITLLKKLSPVHSLMVVNDNIIFFPKKIQKIMQTFANNYGFDLLSVLDKSRDYDKLMIQMNNKEQEVQRLKIACDEREAILLAKSNGTTVLLNQIYKRLIDLKEDPYQISKIMNHPQLFNIPTEYKSNDTSSYIANLEMHLAKLQSDNYHTHKIVNDLHLMINNIYCKFHTFKHFILLSKHRHAVGSKLSALKQKTKVFIRPKLGHLNIHPPKQMIIPKYYGKGPTSKNQSIISIVTPSFNQADFLERTIKSVLNQGYPKLEYIIQDGGSTDQTKDILNKYSSSFKYWESLPDRGQSNAINLGFQHATGEIMAYINSDDIYLPGTLHYVANYFAKHQEVDVIYGHRILINANDMEIGRWILPKHNSKILDWADYIPQETLFWRRRIWDKVGGTIDENFQFAMDWDLILRFKEVGAKFSRVPRFLGAFRIHHNQKTSTNISQIGIAEMQYLRKRCIGREVTFEEIKKGIRSYMIQHVVYNKLYRAGILRY
jgi:glycosyltransferase involved in cell wall biosynthesis